MSEQNVAIKNLANREYQYGFVTDIDEDRIAPGLSEDVVRLISAKKQKAENDRMAALYRQHVLKEESPVESGLLQIKGLGGKKKGETVGVS